MPCLIFAFLAFFALFLGAQAASPEVKPGLKCPHCVFAGQDLSNQCVKGGNLEGADFSGAKLVMACMSVTNFRGAKFTGADLSGANISMSKLDGADFSGAVFSATQARGTDFTHVRGLTQAQLSGMCGDKKTRLPAGLSIPMCD
ncbi:uncharacterized protein YjbI with pentapeptide repeats [Rhizomicrobium palustre]|uniref:Uncharacterized protein YjbI with pentapeptide repeats n=1 Tax=Rhizomicrobium palustre TaxID=189966 RepID=A0A846N1N0_9PROT|nr:pentapeptide repeat-containing protein [Rhizomicrobium palustre]NIK89375.1 uncharacterized protein YjbI with pentapeptide repeats [Rhizomicrobium palustre]